MLFQLIIYLILATGLSYLFQIIMHEIGHLVGGILTGWRFVSLQIFHFVITREKSFHPKKVSSMGCQCIMSPRSIDNKARCYTLGGVGMNLVMTMMAGIGMLMAVKELVIFLFLLTLFAAGASVVLMNGITSTRRVCNDMSCYRMILNDNTRRSHNAQLIIAAGLAERKSYRDMDLELFFLPEGKADNDILAYHAILAFYYHLDRDEYPSAQEALNKIVTGPQVSATVQKIFRMEVLYLDMLMDLLGNDTAVINKTYDGHVIEEYIAMNETRGDVHTARLKVFWKAYQCYIRNDLEEAVAVLDRGIENIERLSCLYSGEYGFCMDQLVGIRNMLRRDITYMKKVDSI